ncbi:MAG TPA: hypothetical protein PKK00_01445 [Bacteroidales bacterium]|nr:hypothetical protein [Bacteroidales bacterium]HPS16118.1 hypothetical protein [Bacteroidales bacterium]
MKKIFLATLLFSVIAFSVNAQKDSTKNSNDIKTIFGNKKISHGAYFGFSVGYSLIDDKDAFTSGGRLMWVINHNFAWGLAGSGFASNFHENSGFSLQGGYGGLMFEPILLPKSPVHLSFPVLLAAGGVGKMNISDNWDEEYFLDDADAFVIAEPGVELEMNLIKFIRISVGASYRFTSDIYLNNESHDVLNGFNTMVNLKFGKF